MITYGHHVANETPDSVFRLVPSNMKTEGFLPDSYRTVVNGLNPFHSPTTSAGDSLWNYAGELRMAEGFRPSRELARRQECTFVNNHIQLDSTLTVLAASAMISTTSPWRSPLFRNVPAVCRSRFILPGVSSKRIEARADPLRRGIRSGKQSLFQSISAQFILARGTAALFSRRLMISTPNGSLPSM